MSIERFVQTRQPAWDELQALSRRAGTRIGRLTGPELLRAGALYRSAVADLAQARRSHPGDPLVDRLETLVRRTRPLVYRRAAGMTLWRYVSTGYWQLVTERPLLLAVAVGILIGPAVVAGALGWSDPDRVIGIIPDGFLWLTEPRASTDQGLDNTGLTAFSAFLFVNNTRVTFVAFGAGIAFGLLTVLLVGYNGVLLGAVSGIAIGNGNTALLVEATVAHGIIELSAIVIGALGGLRLGMALARPGLESRRTVLAAEARAGGMLVLGTVPLLLVAAGVEAFVSRTGTPAGPAAIIGVGLGGIYWGLVAWRGGQKRTRDLVRT